jgi:ABC-type amino acid transport substrate-binding protein
MAELTDRPVSEDLIERATAMSAAALRTVDLLVVLPLASGDPIHVGDEEYPELRDAMNDRLLDLIDDPDVIGTQLTVTEITGDPAARLAALEALVGEHASRPAGTAWGK